MTRSKFTHRRLDKAFKCRLSRRDHRKIGLWSQIYYFAFKRSGYSKIFYYFHTYIFYHMDKDVVDLIMFLDICQIYLESSFTKRKRNKCIGTLWGIITFIRTEKSLNFLRWCRVYNLLFLRYRDNIRNDYPNNYFNHQINRSDRSKDTINVLDILQQIFYCRCIVRNWKF